MEWCEVFYAERISVTGFSRIMKTLLVLLLLFAVTTSASFGETLRETDRASGTEAVLSADAAGQTVDPYIARTIESGQVISALSALNTEDMTAILIPDAMEDVQEEVLPKISETVTAPEPIIQDPPAAEQPGEKNPQAVIPSDNADDITSGITEDTAAEDAQEPAAPAVPPETPPAVPGEVVVDGFLVNESGIICGISDPDLVEDDGYMELPAEGCSGIAAGTFRSGLPSVREIFIPSNISYIEEGAFAGLSNVEWFETEAAGDYYTDEGVLFSEGGTCILAFPAGRTGNYKVPSQVVRFAPGAFEYAQIEVLDATSCALADRTGVPDNITLLERETP